MLFHYRMFACTPLFDGHAPKAWPLQTMYLLGAGICFSVFFNVQGLLLVLDKPLFSMTFIFSLIIQSSDSTK